MDELTNLCWRRPNDNPDYKNRAEEAEETEDAGNKIKVKLSGEEANKKMSLQDLKCAVNQLTEDHMDSK